jgi:hypothetical protein
MSPLESGGRLRPYTRFTRLRANRTILEDQIISIISPTQEFFCSAFRSEAFRSMALTLENAFSMELKSRLRVRWHSCLAGRQNFFPLHSYRSELSSPVRYP